MTGAHSRGGGRVSLTVSPKVEPASTAANPAWPPPLRRRTPIDAFGARVAKSSAVRPPSNNLPLISDIIGRTSEASDRC